MWNPTNPDHERFFLAEVLAPLIAATRPPDLRSREAVRDTARAWVLAFADTPAEALVGGVARYLRTRPKWMPRPGDLIESINEAVAALRAEREEQALAILDACPNHHEGGTAAWVRVVGEDGIERVERCACFSRMRAALHGLPEPLALPPADDPV